MAGEEPVASAVEAEALAACSDDPSNKTQDHYASRRKLFSEVDRLIKGRVKEVLPGVTLEFKQQIDKDLGLDALRLRVARAAAGVEKDAERLSGLASATLDARVEKLFERLEQEVADTLLAAFVNKASAIVAKEVGRQLAKLLDKPAAKEHRVRAKKKATRKGQR